MSLLVNEQYEAHQGEGLHLGTPCTFVRLHGCPVGCSWCDTAYTWDGSEKGTRVEVLDVVARIPGNVRHVVLTGGEPLIQPDVPLLLAALEASGRTVEVETSGTQPVVPGSYHANVSPKLPSAKPRVKTDAKLLFSWAIRPAPTTFKFVVRDEEDYDAMRRLVIEAGIPDRMVVLMPEGRTHEEQAARAAWLSDFNLKQSVPYRLTPRWHIHVYDKERKR